MKKNFKFIIIYFVFVLSLFSENIEDIINPVISSLLKEKNIESFQFLLFKPNKVLYFQFHYDLKTKDIIMEKNPQKLDNYFVGELSYPVINFILQDREIVDNEFIDDPLLKEIQNHLSQLKNHRIRLYDIKNQKFVDNKIYFILTECLKNMLCGIETSKEGIKITKTILKNKIDFKSLPFERFYLSTYNYYLLENIYNKKYKNIIDYLNQKMQFYKLETSLFFKGNLNKEIFTRYNIKRGSYSDQKITYIPDLEVVYPLSYGFITNVYDYYKILKEMFDKNFLFESYYTIEPSIGGYKNGFFYRYSCDKKFLVAENFGFFPGYSSYSFIMNNGYGFILMQSSDNEFTINFLRDKIEEIYYQLNNVECNYISKFDGEFIDGYYRPLNVIDDTKSIFSDIWIRRNTEGYWEVSNFFNKDPIGFLYKVNQDIYFRGYIKLNRYPILLKQDLFITGIYEYIKIPWYKSIRGLIILFSFFILFILMFLIAIVLNYYKRK